MNIESLSARFDRLRARAGGRGIDVEALLQDVRPVEAAILVLAEGLGAPDPWLLLDLDADLDSALRGDFRLKGTE